MFDYQVRVVTELEDLNDKTMKLAYFLTSTKCQDVPNAEIARLRRQLAYMLLYADVLRERIANFKQ
jgi:hypothetical protein